MKKITIFCAFWFSMVSMGIYAQQETIATALNNPSNHKGISLPGGQSKAIATIYDTSRTSNQGAEITAAPNGPAASMGDAIVLAGTERYLQSVTVDLFNLVSAAPYNLTISIYTDCTSAGTAAGPCGTGSGVLIPGSVITQTVTPGALGTIYQHTFNYNSLNLSSEVDNTITVMLNASRSDVYWRLGDNVTVGAQPAGEPGLGLATRCGSSAANNGCSRNFGIQNNFTMTLIANSVQGDISQCSLDPPLPLGPGSGVTTLSTINVTQTGVIGTSTGNYVFDEVSMDLVHSWANDLEIILISPSGTQVALTTDNGGSGGLDVQAILTFRDDSPNNVSAWTVGSPLANYRAEGGATIHPVGAGAGPGVDLNTVFAGEPVNGIWTLRLYDDANGDGGTIFDFCIDFIEITQIGAFPQIVCPNDIIINNETGTCGAQVFFNNAQALDPEDGLLPVTQTMGPGTGSVFPIGDTIIEYSATDSDGNTSTCQFTITVEDVDDPIAVCQDITVELDETGTVTIFAEDLNFGAGTPEPLTPISCSGNPGPTSAADTNLVSFNIVGENFTEIDFNNPCPGVTGLQDQTALSVDLIPGEQYTAELMLWTCGGTQYTANANVWVDFNGDGVLTGDELILLGSQTFVSGGGPTGGSPTGGTTLTANFTVPASAEVGSVIIRAMVQETATTNLNPCASYSWGSMADFTANLTAAGQGSSDGCGPVTFSFDEDGLITSMVLDCSNLGENTITLYVTDEGGNVVSCESTVTVEDNIAPVIVCGSAPGLVTISEDFEGATMPTGWSTVVETGTQDWEFGSGVMPGGADFPTNAAIFDDDAAGSGQINLARLLSPVFDLTGAVTANVSFDYSLQDFVGDGELSVEVWDGSNWVEILFATTDQAPINSGLIDVLAYSNADFQVRFTYDDNGGWAWGAGIDNFMLEYEIPGGAIPQYVLDINGEVTVDINDLYTSASDNCSVTVSAGGAGGGTSTSLTTGFAGGNGNFGTFFDINALTDVTIDSFDANMQAGAPVDVHVYYKPGTWVGSQTDQSAWTLIGQTTATVPNGSGVPTPLNLNLGQVINAGETGAFYVTAPVLNGGFSYTNGTGVGNVWASDANIEFLEGGAVGGFFTGGLFQPRVFNGNIHYTTGGGGSGSGLTFTCDDLGIVNVIVTATDSSGNTTTCTTQIEIIDNMAPVIVGEDITVELGADGTVCIEPEDLFGIIPPEYNVITISSDNGSGSVGFTDFVVTVTQNVSVSFDWSYTTNDGPGFDSFGYIINGVYTELTNPGGANNQTGNATVPLTAGQVFGFRSQSDDGIFGPSTTTVSNFQPGFTGQFDPANWTEILTNSDGSAVFVEITPGSSSAFDNCGITVTAIDISCFTCADIGTPVTVTVFASDASGNITSTTAVVTVIDMLGPVIDCPADMTVDTDPDSITYTLPDYIGDGIVSVTDNCTDPVTIYSQTPAPGSLLLDGTYTITLTAEDEYGNESSCSFELTVDTILGTEENELGNAISMYPNPASGFVNLRNSSAIALTDASIYDITGKLVSKFDLSQMNGEQRLDVSNLASGVYLVYINSETASVVKRLIKK